MKEKIHSLLSASSAERWLHCHVSARLAEKMPNIQSTFAKEGMLAHEIAELKLKNKYIEHMSEEKFNKKMNTLIGNNNLYDPVMQEYTDQYVDFIQNIVQTPHDTSFIEVEKQVQYNTYAPEGFGTTDCFIIKGRHLWVIDFKYGEHVKIEVENNSQLKLYALGILAEYKPILAIVYPKAFSNNTTVSTQDCLWDSQKLNFYALAKFGFIHLITDVTLCIVQPRMGNIATWDINTQDLYQWGNDVVKPIAQKAYSGIGKCEPGSYCQFCPVKPICKAYAYQYDIQKDDKMKEPKTMSTEEISYMLEKLDGVVNYYKNLKKYALAEALKGTTIPKFKIVEGRSARSFKNINTALQKIKDAGFDESLFYERIPLTLTGFEKILGKTQFRNLLASDVIKPKGKPTLVPETDKRKPFKQTNAAKVFEGIELKEK